MNEWTEGVCGDGAAILRDGVPVPITEILAILNNRLAPRLVEVVLPSHKQCTAARFSGEPTELERFIYDNEPAGLADAEWRRDLALVLAEAINEDRWARLQ